MPNRLLPAARPGIWLAAVCVLLAAACDRWSPVASNPRLPEGPDKATALRISCTGSVAQRTVSCQAPAGQDGGPSHALFGGQNQYVRLTSSNIVVTEASEPGGPNIFAFDVTVQNLLNEAMGTADGVNVDTAGVRVVFHAGPTVTGGTGSISVANPDGLGTFTSTNQPFFRYDTADVGGVLDGVIDGGPGEVSAPRRWELAYTAGVTDFAFEVIVDAAVEPLIRINEVMANPAAVQDSMGEYVEVINRGTFAVDLDGWYIQDGTLGGTAAATAVQISGTLRVPGGQTALLGRVADAGLNGGIEPDFAFQAPSSVMALSNSGNEFIRIRTPRDVTIDSVWYTSGAIAAAAGVARERVAFGAGSLHVDSSGWRNAEHVYNGTDRGTPTPVSGILPGANGGVTLSTSNPAMMPVGYDKPVFYVVRGPTGDTIWGATITWESLDSAVATVDSMGYVTGAGPGTVAIRATASTGATGSINFTVVPATASHTANYRNHVEFGVPTDATPDDEFAVNRPQFRASYHPGRRSPNWVAWNLNASHFEQGGTNDIPRCNCFTDEPFAHDTARSYDWDYRNSGYDRGHMVQSESRTNTFQENATTFYLSNILPQAGANNQGPWLRLEEHLNSLVQTGGKEVYIVAGGQYSDTVYTLKDAGRVRIPDYTWKVALILDAGHGLTDVASAADVEVIAVRMPNLTEQHTTVGNPRFAGTANGAGNIRSNGWEMYVTTVDDIESATGYDLFAALNDLIEDEVEARHGNGGAPVATRLSITTEPSATATSGQPLTQQPVVRVLDQNGANLSQSGIAVSASLLGSGGTLGGTTTLGTNGSGVAGFTNLSISGTGTFRIRFASGTLVPDTSLVITVSEPVDEPPTVTSTTPINGATGVTVNSTVVINFSEPVATTGSAFTLQCPSGTPHAFTVSGTGSSRTLTPDSALPASTTCQVQVIAAEVTDLDGTADEMGSDHTFSFTTGAGGPAPSAIVINEIMADPAAVTDANGEYFEVYNPGGAPVNLQGWRILSNGTSAEINTGHVIAGSLVVPAGGYAVLGVNSDTATNGKVTVNYVYTGITLANNTTDWLRLVDGDGNTIDEVHWGAAPGETASSPTAGRARELTNPSRDNQYMSGASSNWANANAFITGTSGDRGTPGTQNSVYTP